MYASWALTESIWNCESSEKFTTRDKFIFGPGNSIFQATIFAEIGEVIAGKAAARTTETTIFKSLGRLSCLCVLSFFKMVVEQSWCFYPRVLLGWVGKFSFVYLNAQCHSSCKRCCLNCSLLFSGLKVGDEKSSSGKSNI